MLGYVEINEKKNNVAKKWIPKRNINVKMDS